MAVQKIACIGAGYVGAPTSAVLAYKCPHLSVTVLDICEERIARFNSSMNLPIYEPGLAEVLNMCRRRGNLSFSTDLAKHIEDADVIFVCVNTPTKVRGIGAGSACDLMNWENAGRAIAKFAKKGHKIIVEKSTVPLRAAEALAGVITANIRPGVTFDVLSNPEFLAEGSAITDLISPDRVLIGGQSKRSQEVLAAIYSQWVSEERILLMDVWSSELSKLAANAFLAQRISSINAIAELCEKSGADVTSVSKAIGMDKRIGSEFLNASVGFGGSCFKKDILSLVYICRSFGLNQAGDYWESIVTMNNHSKTRFVHKIVTTMFHNIRTKRIAIFGFAFKRGTADVRDTPALDVCLGLLEEGATLYVYDPLVEKSSASWEAEQQGKDLKEFDKSFFFTRDPVEAVSGADAIVILTDTDSFKTFDYAKFYSLMRKPSFIFDGRILLDHLELAQIGFEVASIGKSPIVKSI